MIDKLDIQTALQSLTRVERLILARSTETVDHRVVIDTSNPTRPGTRKAPHNTLARKGLTEPYSARAYSLSELGLAVRAEVLRGSTKVSGKPGRICAVCGKSDGTATYGFSGALRAAGLPNWRDDKAHPKCVAKLGKSA